mgnify:CR=1 FL=1
MLNQAQVAVLLEDTPLNTPEGYVGGGWGDWRPVGRLLGPSKAISCLGSQKCALNDIKFVIGGQILV